MRNGNVPPAGRLYWAALAGASVFGADCGDCVSHLLGLGHLRGLPVLALLFALVLLLERRLAVTTAGFYWVAIVLLRTGATNVGDLLTHDLHLGYGRTALALLGALVAAASVVARRTGRRPDEGALPRVDGCYWVAMFLAGTFGTVGGDLATRLGGHDAGLSTAALLPALAVAALARGRRPGIATYWVLVAAIRTVGTTAGDWSADATSLPFGTAASGVAFAALVALPSLRRRRRRRAMALSA